MMQWDGIVPMSKIECSICSRTIWLLLRSEKELHAYVCDGCFSSFIQIMNRIADDEYIEWYKRNSI